MDQRSRSSAYLTCTNMYINRQLLIQAWHTEDSHLWMIKQLQKSLGDDSVKLSQETNSEQKTGKAEVENCLLDRVAQPSGRHLQHLFWVSIVFAHWGLSWGLPACSQPRVGTASFLEPRPVSLVTVFSLWSKSFILISRWDSIHSHTGDTLWT